MEREVLLDEVRRFDPRVPIEEASTPPASWYTASEFYEIERDVVFGKTWQPVARVDQVANPGDFITGCLAGEPWVVLRDADGEIRAFHNTCRHKGREVVQGSGNAGELVCGYHAWSYQLDGRLKSAPQMAGIKNFDRAEMSLVPLRAEVWGQWVFINGDPIPVDIGDQWSRVRQCTKSTYGETLDQLTAGIPGINGFLILTTIGRG